MVQVLRIKAGAGAHKTGIDVDMVDGQHAEDFLLSDPVEGKKKILNMFWDGETEEIVIVIEE